MTELDKKSATEIGTAAELGEFLDVLVATVQRGFEWVAARKNLILDVTEQFLERDFLERHGWLPHPSISVLSAELIEVTDPTPLIIQHYRDRWASLKTDFSDRVGRVP